MSNTYYSNGGDFDLVQGHSDLIKGQFDTSIWGHYKEHRHKWLLLQVAFFKFPKVKIPKPTMTLRKSSRSNKWYVRKVFDESNIHAHSFDPRYYSLWPENLLHRNTFKKWTLTHKIQKVGHSDLVLGSMAKGDTHKVPWHQESAPQLFPWQNMAW